MKQLNQILILILLLAVIGVGGYFATKQIKGKSSQVREAVFLTNGQVYFGYVTKANANTLTLDNIYYLQVQQPLQPPKDTSNQQPQISLVKLGNELHGPEDEMIINSREILFREKMKSDSKVNQAIAAYEKNGGSNSVDTTPAATTSPQPTK